MESQVADTNQAGLFIVLMTEKKQKNVKCFDWVLVVDHLSLVTSVRPDRAVRQPAVRRHGEKQVTHFR